MSQPKSPSTHPNGLPGPSSPDHQAGSSNPPRPTATFKPRSISFASPSTVPSTITPPQFGRRSSIQFTSSLGKSEELPEITKKEPIVPSPPRRLRNPSPPPPLTYQPRVSFDTFQNTFVPDQEFTLVCKHNCFTYGRHQRVFLVAIDENSYSEHALKWVIEEMIEDGDELICLRVVEPDPKVKDGASASAMTMYKEHTRDLLRQIQIKNDDAGTKAISIIMEFAVGSVEQTIMHMIQIYSPSFLTVGTRGKSLGGLQGLLPGSVSKWCVQNSPVPVVVVRHPEKRRKKRDKRSKDDKRKGYATIQEESAKQPGNQSVDVMEGKKPIETEEGEAEAVAIAVTKTISLFDKRSKRKGKGVDRDEDKVTKSRDRSRSPTSRGRTDEINEGTQDESQSEDEGEEETDGEEDDESDDESEDEDNESPGGTEYAEGIETEQISSHVGQPDHSVDNDVEGLTLEDKKDIRSAS